MKIGEVEFDHEKIEFVMDGDHFAVLHNGKKTYIDENQFTERTHSQTFEKMKGIDAGSIGLEAGKFIRIPKVVLKTRDLVIENRASDPMRKMMKKINESWQPFGVLEFFMFEDTLFLYFERDSVAINDADLIKTDKGVFFKNESIKAIPETEIPIPDDVLKARDEIRTENEHKRRFRTLAIKDGFEYILIEDKLIIRHEGKEAIATEICNIYERSAVNVEPLELGYPYLELPHVVEEEFKKVLDEKLPEGLKLVHAGKSLLNGKGYWKTNLSISEKTFDKVKAYFEYYGPESEDFSGWLTCYPDNVAEALNIEIEGI